MPLNDKLTYDIIGCAIKVHSTLGNGFQEVIYQRALSIELNNMGIAHVREQEMPVFYDGHEIGTRRADFLIENKVLVELKALIKLEDVHLAQGLNYLTAYNLPVGLLINFGSTKLEFKRLFRKNSSCTSLNPVHPDSDTYSSCPSFNPEYPDSDNCEGVS